jgi:hypothetical protein
MRRYFTLILCLFLSYSGYVCAYDETYTHQNITLQAAGDPKTGKVSICLKQNLGFEGGLETKLPSNGDRTVLDWLQRGSFDEDQPICRRSNHFHNPLETWSQSYMNDDTSLDGVLIRSYCNVVGWPYSERKSNVTWGTGYLSPNGTPITRYNQDMGWDNARDYYYWALTSISNTGLELFFTKTFRAVGQVLHLLQDVSVPAHVRNDFTSHEVFLGMESLDPIIFLSNRYEHYLQNRSTLIFSLTLDFPSFSNPRITDFWDTEQYNGENPSESLSLGLSEFANANYFSDWTIPNNNPTTKHIFPYPKVNKTNTRICEDYAQNSTEIRKYISRKECPPLTQERKADHFVVISLVNEESIITNENISSLKLSLDENVHDTYAKELLPRAVGYSAGLLNYFFRGEFQVTAVPIFYKNGIQYLRVKIKNMTLNETMKDGEFTVTYSYRPSWGKADASDDIWGQSPVVPSGTLEYGGDDQNPVEDTVIDFWIPEPIPKGSYDSVKFTLAFKGTLGNEVGAVIGKVLTLGEIKFGEEWDNGLNGNYTWAHTDFNLLGQNPANGSTSNIIDGDTLIKDNIRHVGYKTARVNDSFLSTRYNNGQFKGILPIKITRGTYIQFKIDEMSINQIPAAPQGYTNQYQGLWLHFNNGLVLQYTQEGQGIYYTPTTATYIFEPGLIIVDNIYQLFQIAQIPIPAGDMYLEEISFVQQLFPLDNLSDVEHHQRMKIDSIRIIEEKQQ